MARDPYKYFRVEVREILDELGQAALDLEKGVASDAVARLLRVAHTLKGAARVVKERQMADRAHALEDALMPMRDTKIKVPREVVERVFALIDGIGADVARLPPPPPAEPDAKAAPPEEPLLAFRPAIEDLDALVGSVFEAHAALGALRPQLLDVERGRYLSSLLVDQIGRVRVSDTHRPTAIASAMTTLERAGGIAEDLRDRFNATARGLASSIDHLDREFAHVRAAAERLRLAPARALFLFLERAVRDAARDLGKRVTFDTAGGDIRLDALVLTRVQDALLHIVRNAVAHGIEGEHERVRAGKPAAGTVTVRVTRRGRFVAFACTDDGRGIDLDAVRRALHEKGVAIEEDDASNAVALIGALLKGGVSTAATVTTVAGRGIGLNVAHETATRLGGEVLARTAPGAGTTVELVVPLSIASFSALTVEIGDAVVAIPLDAVREARRVARDDVHQTESGDTIQFDGQDVRVVALTDVVSPAAAASPLTHVSVVVVAGTTGTIAFTVDRILSTEHLLVRPLPDFAPASAVVAGTALDGAGDPRLVLEPDELIAAAQRVGATAVVSASRVSVLVIDDSLTTRMLEQSILESAGYDVDVATSAEEGLEKARAAAFDLFLVDVEMPGMDGFAFIERVKNDPRLHGTPSILVTSRNLPEDRERAREVGARAYVVKGEFDQRVLLEHIRKLAG